MSRVQSGAVESARFGSGSVEVSHPLLRLAMRRLHTHSAYLHFRLVVRDLCQGRIQDAERVAAIDTLLAQVSTWLGEGRQLYELGKLRCELLQLAAADCSDPCLLEELSYARLSLRGLKVVWAQDKHMLPRLVATSSEASPTDWNQRWATTRLWSEGAKDWAEVVGEAEARGSNWLGSLNPVQQDAVRRCLVMHSAFGSTPSSPGGAVKRQEWWRSHGTVILAELSRCKGSADSDDGDAAALIQAMTDELRRQVDGGAIEVVPFELHEDEVQAAAHEDWHLVIRSPVPPASYKDDVNELNRYRPLTVPVPVARLPSLALLSEWTRQLSDEFPWARAPIDELMKSLRVRVLFGASHLILPPVLLVGPPGSGKSRLARKLAQTFGLAFLPISLGGMHDTKLLTGTARGWGGACASPLLLPLLHGKSASALVLLDEIDKLGRYGEGPPAVGAALLGLLEQETAARFHDTFLQTTVDLSKVLFVATANSLSIPAPLLSRFKIYLIPHPGPEHADAISRTMMKDIAGELGVDPELMPEPPTELIRALKGNIRQMRAALWTFLHEWATTHLVRERLH